MSVRPCYHRGQGVNGNRNYGNITRSAMECKRCFVRSCCLQVGKYLASKKYIVELTKIKGAKVQSLDISQLSWRVHLRYAESCKSIDKIMTWMEKKMQFFPFLAFHEPHSHWCNIYSIVQRAVLMTNGQQPLICKLLNRTRLHRLQTNIGLSQFRPRYCLNPGELHQWGPLSHLKAKYLYICHLLA